MMKQMYLLSLLLQCHSEITICPLVIGSEVLSFTRITSSREVFQKLIKTFNKNAWTRMPTAKVETSFEQIIW